MKKVAMVAASALLAGVMCIGFAACGSSAKDIAGEEVTAEQWAEAFKAENFENVKMVAEEKREYKYSVLGVEVQGSTNIKTEVVIAGDLAYIKMEGKVTGDAVKEGQDSEITVEYYFDSENEKVYGKEDGKWVEISLSEVTGVGSPSAVVGMYASLADYYDAFEYSAEDKGYVVKEGMYMGDMGVLKFKDGKLAAIWEEENEEEDGEYAKYSSSVVITYGGQTVTLPTVG